MRYVIGFILGAITAGYATILYTPAVVSRTAYGQLIREAKVDVATCQRESRARINQAYTEGMSACRR